MNHTPGPWKVKGSEILGRPRPWPRRTRYAVRRADSRIVAHVAHGDNGEWLYYPESIARANRALIAEAPALYRALRELVEDLVDAEQECDPDTQKPYTTVAAAQAVLKRLA